MPREWLDEATLATSITVELEAFFTAMSMTIGNPYTYSLVFKVDSPIMREYPAFYAAAKDKEGLPRKASMAVRLYYIWYLYNTEGKGRGRS